MPDIFFITSKWWKQMLAVVLLSLLAVGIITFLKPRQYLSVTTALPASSVAADKARIFNENIEELYSSLGSPDELDRIVGTAQLDTVYLAVTDEFNLYDHYKIEKTDDAARIKSARLLRRNSHVLKSDYGELKIKVWDTDKKLAPQLADAIMSELETIHENLQSAGNRASLNGLQSLKKKIQVQIDSINRFLNQGDITEKAAVLYTTRRDALNGQLQNYEKLINEYELMLENKPPVLVEVEKAQVANRPDKPRRLLIMIVTAFLSLFFALLLALILEKRKKEQA